MTERSKGVVALAVVLFAWSLSSVFAKYLIREGYDPHTQNFYRYAAGALAVLPFFVRRVRQRGAWPKGRLLGWLLLISIPNLAHQICWVTALRWIDPGLSAFLNKSSVLFAALLAFVFYREERWLLRSRRFLAGVSLTLVGTAGLALLRGDLETVEVNRGVGLVLVAAAAWAVYSVGAKNPTIETGSTVSFGVVSLCTSIVLLPVACLWGNLGHWNTVPWHVNAIMLGSGVFCIGLAHTLYFYALSRLTVSVCATMLLTTPLGTWALSRWLFGEQMSAGQILSGIALLVGGALTLLAKERPTSSAVAHAAQAADA